MTVHVVGRIHGHDGADALRVEKGAVAEIGLASNMTGRRVDHAGGIVLPGLRDGHIHPIGLAAADNQVDLSDVTTIEQALERIRERAAQSTGPVVAVAFDDERLAEHRMPTALELDSAVDDRPVLVYRHCSHRAAANSAALRTAGLGRESPNPTGGRIGRNLDGSLNGALEETAIALVSTPLSAESTGPTPAALRNVLHRLAGRGVVSVDAMVSFGASMWCAGPDELGTILAVADDPIIDISVFVICDSVAELRDAARRLDSAGPGVRFAGWKGFADGSLGARTAALRAPYADDPATSGLMVGSNLAEMSEAAVDLGGVAAIHAIGDRAVQAGLDIAASLGPNTVRIEHASVIDPDQVAHMATAQVLASVQPSFATSDGEWIERRLGSQRAAWAYPFASMQRAGVTMRGGSDAPIESSDPFVGIQDACLPRAEALDRESAIDLYVAAPLEVGVPATFLICDADPLRVPVDEISQITVRQMWIAGERVK
ncbi:MAG: amidohydrolase [Acidimicrobiia bacterium]